MGKKISLILGLGIIILAAVAIYHYRNSLSSLWEPQKLKSGAYDTITTEFDPEFVKDGGLIKLFKNRDNYWESELCDDVGMTLYTENQKFIATVTNCPGLCLEDIKPALDFDVFAEDFSEKEIDYLLQQIEKTLPDNGSNYIGLCLRNRCDNNVDYSRQAATLDECGKTMSDPRFVGKNQEYPGFQTDCLCDIQTRVIQGEPCDISETKETKYFACWTKDSGLISHWDFETIEKVYVIDKVGDHDGTITKEVTLTRPGIKGNAIQFGGDKDYITIPDSEYLSLDEFTISLWVNFVSEENDILISKGQFPNYNYKIAVSMNPKKVNQKNIDFAIGAIDRAGQPYQAFVRPNYDFLLEKWYHIVGTFGNNILSLYINGELIAEKEILDKAPTKNRHPIVIGSYTFPVNFPHDFKGYMDEIQIYNKPLTEDEIYKIYKSNASDEPSESDEPQEEPVDGCVDMDGDGYKTGGSNCGPIDCDDNNPNRHPNNTEILCNNLDENCNGLADDDQDADNDGVTTCNNDCDDNDPNRYPGNPEIHCDNIDQNCNGLDDDDKDADGDTITVCQGDCNDYDPTVHPGALELCDAIDQNCNLDITDVPQSVCDDGLPCTTDACVAPNCTHTPVNSVCNDDNVCTDDVCNVQTGCQNTPNMQPGCTP